MRVAIVDPPEPSPAYDMLVDSKMVGFKSSPTNVTPEDCLGGAEYDGGIYGSRNGARFFLPGASCDDPVEPGLGYWVAFTEPATTQQ